MVAIILVSAVPNRFRNSFKETAIKVVGTRRVP